MTKAVAVLATLPVLAACGGARVEPQGRIAFTVNRAGWSEIWSMRADGSERHRLTDLPPPRTDAVGSLTPAWSPDGTQLAFATQIGAAEDPRATEIYVMQADGSDPRRITTNEAVDAEPTWSPDGNRIAFARLADVGTETARGGIFVMSADGGSEVQITRVAAPTFDGNPAWSPNGFVIAFTRVTVTSDPERSRVALYVVKSDGAGLKKLIDGGGQPAWSPDGKRIAFASIRDHFGRTCFEECSPSGEIYVVDADGSDARRLTTSEADDRSPTWSPDGRFLAFVSDRSNRDAHGNEIYVMRDDGSDVRRITRNTVWDLDPDWGY